MGNSYRYYVLYSLLLVLAPLLSVPAFAGGDLSRNETPALWQGFYAGGHIGGAFTSFDAEGEDEINPDGFVGGVHIGVNYQNGNVVLGVEGDFSKTGGKESYFGDEIQQNYLASVRGRVGYAADATLVYVTGGVAWSEAEVKGEKPKFDFTGFVFGAGLDHKLSDTLSLKGDVLHYQFDEDFDGDNIELDSTVLRLGISWHLN
ncbi:MAG: outer membrane protein [Methyloligellaceae bacterium]